MPSKPRVCLLAPFPCHRLPGNEAVHTGHHATWLPPLLPHFGEQSDFDIHWVTFSKQTRIKTTLSFQGQTFHLLPRGRLSLQILSGFRRECGEMRSLIRDLEPALVHGWGSEEGYGLAAISQSRHLVSMQGLLNAYRKAATQHPLLRWQARNERDLLAHAGTLTVESEWGRRILAPLAPRARIEVVEYGVAPSCFSVKRHPASDNTVLFVGTLSKLKGVDVLLDAFADPRLRQFRLVLLGNGPLHRHDYGPHGNVEFMGHCSPESVREWMSRAAFLIHPTRADTSPNCVKEARVIGMPVATTPNGGQAAYVKDGQSGVIFPSGDREALIQSVIRIATLISENPDFGSHGAEDCRRRLDAGLTANAFLDLYRSMIS